MDNYSIKALQKQDNSHYQLPRELSKSSNILENRYSSTQANATLSGIGHPHSDSNCSKSEFEACRTQNSITTPENLNFNPGRYSNVLASTNFTVSENITKDSGIGGEIMERVVTDLLANFEEKFELEKGLWDIDDYIGK